MPAIQQASSAMGKPPPVGSMIPTRGLSVRLRISLLTCAAATAMAMCEKLRWSSTTAIDRGCFRSFRRMGLRSIEAA